MITVKELNSMSYNEISDLVEEIGEKSFRGDQIFNFIHKNKVEDIDEMTNLSKKLRTKLKEISYINNISIYKKMDSKLDKTRKYLFQLSDDNIIESVAMGYEYGNSICVSTQVGCKMGCSFCASTKGGLIRDLSAGEMVEQVYQVEKDLDINITNIVLMGSGEPLDNFDNVVKFIDIITSEKGKNLSIRNITLSTCGVVPNIYKLAELELPITLAISLHSPFNNEREEIMPIAKKYDIDELVKSMKYYYNKTKRRITIEYTLINDINDSLKFADEIGRLFEGMNIHINLIPLNPIEEYKKEASTNNNIKKFKNRLEKYNFSVTTRREMGRDISASCGQLRRSVL